MDQYTRLDKLGEGTYGVVYKAQHKTTGKLVAMKRVRLENEDEGVPATTIREISLLRELDHPNIVKLEDVIMENSRIHLIFEYMSMDLKKYLDSLGKEKYLSQEMLKLYLYQMILSILFCHKRRVLHRDLKPQNILVDGKGVLKIADFGLGRAVGIPVRIFTHEVVTLWYRAPEVLLGAVRYSCPLDMWSVGCIFAEMATKKPLFQGDSEIDQLFRIFRVLRTPTEQIWPGVSKMPDYKSSFPNWVQYNLENHVKNIDKAGLDLLKSFLIYNPLERISAKKAIDHPYFDDLDKSKLPTTES